MYIRYPARGGKDNVVADALSRPPPPSPTQPPPPAEACIKAPCGSQAAARRGGKPNISSASLLAAAEQTPVAGICYEALAAGQLTCSQTQLLRESSTLQIVKLKVGPAQLWCDVSGGVARPLVPALHRRAVFDAVHSLAHQVYEHPGGWWRSGSSGRAATRMWRIGAETASIVREARSPSRLQLQSSPYLYLGGGFRIFTWTW